MRNSIEFLKNELSNLAKKFAGSYIEYQFIEETKLHLIDVKPYDLYDDINYILAEEAIEESLAKNFPDERFLFIGESTLYEIDNPIATFEEIAFKMIKKTIPTNNSTITPKPKPKYTRGINYNSNRLDYYSLAA